VFPKPVVVVVVFFFFGFLDLLTKGLFLGLASSGRVVGGWVGCGGFRGKERRHFEDLIRFGGLLSYHVFWELKRFGFGMSNFHGGCVCRCVCVFFLSLCLFE
jgi:hypothetical protein